MHNPMVPIDPGRTYSLAEIDRIRDQRDDTRRCWIGSTIAMGSLGSLAGTWHRRSRKRADSVHTATGR